MDPAELTSQLKQQARQLGFSLSGACAAVDASGYSRLQQWLDAGYAGQMRYLENRRAAYQHPRSVLQGVRSLLVLAMDYRTRAPVPPELGEGRVSRYAWGPEDYHDLIHERLRDLRQFFAELVPAARVRGVVDTAPLLEREFAQLAGLGWVGKNTLLLNKQHGSYFFLAALLTDQVLQYDEVHAASHCGTCRACLDACPTDAFPEPFVLDASKCISYLTIELRDSIPRELRPGVGSWLFGCDICQDVCPWNRKTPVADEPAFAPQAAMNPIDLAELFQLDDAGFRRRFRHTALWRPRRRGILRNAAVALGNQRAEQAVDALRLGLNDPDPLVREASAWALGQIGGERSQAALRQRLDEESDPAVVDEIRRSLRP